jgi:ATP-dependent RNA helicase DeaD
MPKPFRPKPAVHPSAPKRRKPSGPPKYSAPHKVDPPVEIEEEPEALPLTFAELGLAEPVARAVAELGFETPTPIQARAIPVLLSGKDLIGQAQTGTGKTAAFALPMIQRVDPARNETQALVLAPTRELAVQVAGGIYDFAKHAGIRVVPVYGGQPIDRQFRALRNGAQIVVGTPGRVLDHLRRGSLSIASVNFCALDEADEMLALGFAEDLEAILAELPEERQLAFFSATMPARILALTKKFLRNPEHVTIKSKQRTLDTTNQTYYEVPPGKKLEALARVLDMETPGPTIVFCRTRQETSDLSENLRLRGYNAEALHGDMNQAERDRVMRRFREGQADLLIATDVAARGLDIDTVTHVINYDIPWDVEQYIHRIGRTGRAGRTGDAITLVTGRERLQLKNLERLIGSTIKPARIPSAADIAARRREVFKDSLRETLAARAFESHLATVEELSEEFDTAEVAAAALQMLWQTQGHAQADAAEAMAHDFEQPEVGMTRIFVGMGRQDGLRPGDLVGAITNEAGINGKSIGVVEVLDRNSFVEVPSESAEHVIQALRNCKLRNRKVKVQAARGPMS